MILVFLSHKNLLSGNIQLLYWGDKILLVSLLVAWVACIVEMVDWAVISHYQPGGIKPTGNSCTFQSSTPLHACLQITHGDCRTTTNWLQERLSTIVELHPASLSYYQYNNTHYLSYWLHSIMHFGYQVDLWIDLHDQINQRYYFMT